MRLDTGDLRYPAPLFEMYMVSKSGTIGLLKVADTLRAMPTEACPFGLDTSRRQSLKLSSNYTELASGIITMYTLPDE
jgi:nitric oxide synthase oxygenase domain/subunit